MNVMRNVDERGFPRYATGVAIAHNHEEFILFFQFVMDSGNTRTIHELSTIVLSPVQFKRMLKIMGDQVQGYEQRWGEIEVEESQLIVPERGIVTPQ